MTGLLRALAGSRPFHRRSTVYDRVLRGVRSRARQWTAVLRQAEHGSRGIVAVSDIETMAELCPDCARTGRTDVIAAVGLIAARPPLGGGARDA